MEIYPVPGPVLQVGSTHYFRLHSNWGRLLPNSYVLCYSAEPWQGHMRI